MGLPGEGAKRLEEVLSRLRRPSLADNDVTIECLEAGRDVIAAALDHDPTDAELHPFLAFLSRGEIRRAVEARGLLRVSEGQLRDRWTTPTDYVRDLIAYIRFRRGDRSFAARSGDWIEQIPRQLPKPSHAVRLVATANQTQLVENPLFRLQLLAAAVLGSADGESEAPDLYTEIEARWTPFVEAFLSQHDLSLRPGVSLEMLVTGLIAVGEGIALRELVDPTRDAERGARLSIQGTVAVALIIACTSRGDDARDPDSLIDQMLQDESGA